LFTAFALTLSHLATAIDWKSSPTSWTSGILHIASSAVLCLLSFFEHGRSVAPSTVATVYLAGRLFADVIEVGLLYVAENLCVISPLAISVSAANLILFILEARDKTTILREPYRDLAPEERSGFFGNVFFWWVNNAIAFSYSKVLLPEDLPPLASSIDAMVLRESMQRIWDERSKQSRPIYTSKC
jgi:ATP-binding cassette, subfamily C (CFTR/MRP), member 1